jgi:hypothetical protein
MPMNPPGMVNPNYPQNVMPNMNMGNPEVMNNQKPHSQAMQANAPMANGDAPDNLNNPFPKMQIKPPQANLAKDQKLKAKSPGRKSVPAGDKKPRDPGSKLPTTRKPKIVESIKMQFVQQYFRAADLNAFNEGQNEVTPEGEIKAKAVENGTDNNVAAENAD